jgi:ribonuclease G
MRREIIINASVSETRIALLEDKELVEILVERPEAVRRVGDIYKGRVNAVLPGMQAAFVDLGLEKSAFLHASDLMPDSDLDEMFDEDEDGEDRKRGGGRGRRDEAPPRIEDALKKGQEILVQITKEPIGTKGPGSRPRCRSRAGSSCTCRTTSTWACRGRSRTAPSARG